VIKLDDVVAKVSEFRGLSEVQIRGPIRTRDHVRPRQEFCYLARKVTDFSFPAIGRFISRDHTTVLHSIEQVEKRMAADPEYRREINRMRCALMAKSQPGRVRVMPLLCGPRHTRPQPNATLAQHT
jgi:chromosomal replication initiator protein